MIFDFLQIKFDKKHWWISMCSFTNDIHNDYSLIHIENDYGYWKFDFLFLRNFFRKLKDRLWNW